MKFSMIAAGLAAFAFAGTAQATLVGTTIDVTTGSGFLQSGGCTGLTVGDGVECRIRDADAVVRDVIDVDVQGGRIVFNLLDIDQRGGFFLWSSSPLVFDVVVSGLNWVDDPLAAIAGISTSVELFGTAAPTSPNTIGAVLSGPNQVTLNFGDLGRQVCGSTLCARVTVDLTPGSTQVIPLPAGLPLLLGGLGVLAAFGVRRRG